MQNNPSTSLATATQTQAANKMMLQSSSSSSTVVNDQTPGVGVNQTSSHNPNVVLSSSPFRPDTLNFSIKLNHDMHNNHHQHLNYHHSHLSSIHNSPGMQLSEQHQRKIEMLESRFTPLNPQKSVSQDYSNQSLNSDEQKQNDLMMVINDTSCNTPEKNSFAIGNNVANINNNNNNNNNNGSVVNTPTTGQANLNQFSATKSDNNTTSTSTTKERKRKRKNEANQSSSGAGGPNSAVGMSPINNQNNSQGGTDNNISSKRK
jgi:hypothetical protein